MNEGLRFLKLSPDSKQEVVGSAVDKNIIYSADVDAMELINDANVNILEQEIKNKYNYTPKNVFITDFKCGSYKGYSIKWSKEEVLDGYKTLDNKILYLKDALQQMSRVKLDIIVYNSKFKSEFKFKEYSSIYLIKNKRFKNYNCKLMDNDNTTASLFNDVRRNVEENNLLKAVKRMYSFAKLNDLRHIQKRCLKIINDKTVVELYKDKTQFEITLSLLNYENENELTHIQKINLMETTQVIPLNKTEIENKLSFINHELNSLVKYFITMYKLF